MTFQSSPIVRVAIEPKNALLLPQLVRGLKLLHQADPNVEVFVQETGEHVIVAAGELHLERCIRDLKEQFAKGVDLKVSPPIVSFRETIVVPEHKKLEPVTVSTANRLCSFTVRAVPLPGSVTQLLESRAEFLKSFRSINEQPMPILQKMLAFLEELQKEFKKAGGAWKTINIDTVWSLGPRRQGPNLLVNCVPHLLPHTSSSIRSQIDARIHELQNPSSVPSHASPSLLPESENPEDLPPISISLPTISETESAEKSPEAESSEKSPETDTDTAAGSEVKQDGEDQWSQEKLNMYRFIEKSILGGFQLASQAGPLCEEPMMGVMFRLEHITVTPTDPNTLRVDPYGPLSGQVMSAMKEGCRKAFSASSPRLMEPVYAVNLQATAEVLGKLYGVVSRRRGTILDEQLKEGTNVFSIQALMPVVESFGFAEELRKRTSGVASPQLVFSHFRTLPQDPFFVPTTEEELEEMGSVDNSPNLVRTIVDSVRRRKGLAVEEKIVASATKQRTLSRTK
eukprot:TRINITY_DN5908_c0_g1_i5.p1 TRINITY_DN5908_c0_g1~~TRINITY_DN5908_c0_g1_i5.p1  ORF type:complete len:542 (-),score=204.44 TRINITY_DN5908_c0_g1_i5:28-1563(-)